MSYDHTQTLMMKGPLAVISTISLAGCTHAPGPRDKRAGPPRVTTALVIVDRPTAIGFFPAARDSAEASEDGYSEGIAHIRFALDDTRGCLGHDSGQTILVVTTQPYGFDSAGEGTPFGSPALIRYRPPCHAD